MEDNSDNWRGGWKSAQPRRIEAIVCDHHDHKIPLQVKGAVEFVVRIRVPGEREEVDWEERQIRFTVGRNTTDILHYKRYYETIGDGEVRNYRKAIGRLRIRPFCSERHVGRVFTVGDRPENLITRRPVWEMTEDIMALHGHVQLGESVRFDTYPIIVRVKGGRKSRGDICVTAGMEGLDIEAQREGGQDPIFWRIPYDKIDRFPLRAGMGWQDMLVERYGAGTGYFLEREMDKMAAGYDYADSYRVAEKGVSWEEDEFDKARSCCGQKEWTTKDPKTNRVFRLGFNYGH